MGKLLKSRITAWAAFILIIILICCTFTLRTVWWAYIDIFLIFMMAFCHLMAVYIARLNAASSRMLDRLALIFGIAGIIAAIAEFIALECSLGGL